MSDDYRRAVPPALLIVPDETESFGRGPGIVTRPYFGAWNASDAQLTAAVTEFAPGTGLPEHSHNVEESVLVLSGEATAVIDGQRIDFGAAEAVRVPAGTVHSLSNRGSAELVVYSVFGGPDVVRTIAATGETIPHFPEKAGSPAPRQEG